jgi:hypothetical protein
VEKRAALMETPRLSDAEAFAQQQPEIEAGDGGVTQRRGSWEPARSPPRFPNAMAPSCTSRDAAVDLDQVFRHSLDVFCGLLS